jgi:hypothetical protein
VFEVVGAPVVVRALVVVGAAVVGD